MNNPVESHLCYIKKDKNFAFFQNSMVTQLFYIKRGYFINTLEKYMVGSKVSLLSLGNCYYMVHMRKFQQ